MSQTLEVAGIDSGSLTPSDFIDAFGEVPSAYLAKRIAQYRFDYRRLDRDERDQCLRKIVGVLCGDGLVRAGGERMVQWEAGWGAHLDWSEDRFDRSVLVPGYFGKYGVVRWKQDFIEPLDRQFEYRSFAVIQDWLFDKYLRQAENVYEFGCGTGHNLFRVRDVNADANLWGLDWTEASQKIIARVRQSGVDRKFQGRRFNFFEPDTAFELAPGAAIYTAAALEQVGDRFEPFIAYLLRNRPSLCIHIEPIAELLDESNLVDFLSVAYFRRRNYLSGFLDYLRALERDGKVTLHLARRTLIGSLFIEGYSVVVWSPSDPARGKYGFSEGH